MRKTLLTPTAPEASPRELSWLDLEALAQVEITSEDSQHPIENAFHTDVTTGWRAGSSGEQTVRIIFDQPQSLRRVQLLILEDQFERKQEFVLSWAVAKGQPLHEIVRQQFHFSPTGAVRELESYTVVLQGVRLIELTIMPDRDGGPARASLAQLLLA